MSEPFRKFIEFRKTQPRVYTKEEDSLRDLCRYPLLLWKHLNPHYNQEEYLAFKSQLQEDIRGSYVKTKNEFREVNRLFTEAREKRAADRKRALIQDIALRLSAARNTCGAVNGDPVLVADCENGQRVLEERSRNTDPQL